ncbi:hypothetical protein YC2023_050815 [Brassica napus]
MKFNFQGLQIRTNELKIKNVSQIPASMEEEDYPGLRRSILPVSRPQPQLSCPHRP